MRMNIIVCVRHGAIETPNSPPSSPSNASFLFIFICCSFGRCRPSSLLFFSTGLDIFSEKTLPAPTPDEGKISPARISETAPSVRQLLGESKKKEHSALFLFLLLFSQLSFSARFDFLSPSSPFFAAAANPCSPPPPVRLLGREGGGVEGRRRAASEEFMGANSEVTANSIRGRGPRASVFIPISLCPPVPCARVCTPVSHMMPPL